MFLRQLPINEAQTWMREIIGLRSPGLRAGRLRVDSMFSLLCANDAVSVASAAIFIEHCQVLPDVVK